MNDFYNLVMSHDVVYSLLYSPSKTFDPVEDQIIDINTSGLQWAGDNESFIYIWGGPGPCYNHYSAQTYGKGWAFTKEEIINAWMRG